MSIQWPQGENKDLLIAVANYLSQSLHDSNSSLNEIEVDSLTVAVESLQTIISADCDILPHSKFSLHQLYQLHQQSQKPSQKPSLVKFLEFVRVLKDKKFFHDCTEGSKKYIERLESARLQYNQRFPLQAIDSLQELAQQTKKQKPTPGMKKQPMNVDSNVNNMSASQLKAEGNKLLQNGEFDEAIKKYTIAIEMEPKNAVFYANRCAAYSYKKEYQLAVDDARSAIDINPEYTKAYVRLGLALFELGNYSSALEAYQSALNRTSPSEKNWEKYNDRVEICKQKIEEANNTSGGNGGQQVPDMSAFANMFGGGGGGKPDISSLLSGLGGGGLSDLMKNPMMQQMAQQMMKDPKQMEQMANMMKNMNTDGSNNNNNGNGTGLRDIMSDLMQNPEKAKKVFSAAMEDPEAQQLMADPELRPIFERLKTGDYTAIMDLDKKPKAMEVVKRLLTKYYT